MGEPAEQRGTSSRRRFLTRRRLLLGALGGAGALAAARVSLPHLLRPGPVRPLSPEGEAFARELLRNLDRSRVWDVHVHLVGLGGDGSTGCWVNPRMRSALHPLANLQLDVYAAAAGISPDDPAADRLYRERLLDLHRGANPAGKLVLLAFDWNHGEDGRPVEALSTFHTPNDYVLDVADRNADVRACASIHPYRADAVDELERVAARGAVAIKWLPNAMGIDMASPRCEPFYERARELDLPLLVHTGHERAVESAHAQELGNPYRLRRPLEAGVRVIAAHCASTGECADPDRPGAPVRSAFEAFLELMDDERYAAHLFGDVSAMTQVNRCGVPLATVLARGDLHPRLLFGSDYPLPAIYGIVSTRQLVSLGYLGAETRTRLNEVFERNSLLFDLLSKLALRVEVDGEPRGFRPEVFETARFFGA